MGADDHFVFCIKKGLIYTSFTDFKSQEASDKMHDLLSLYADFTNCKKSLKQNREKYNNSSSEGKDELKMEILSLEGKLEELRTNIFITENLVRKFELKN